MSTESALMQTLAPCARCSTFPKPTLGASGKRGSIRRSKRKMLTVLRSTKILSQSYTHKTRYVADMPQSGTAAAAADDDDADEGDDDGF